MEYLMIDILPVKCLGANIQNGLIIVQGLSTCKASMLFMELLTYQVRHGMTQIQKQK